MTRQRSNTVNTSSLETESSEELIYQNDHAQVSRRTLQNGGKAIVKRALSAQAIQRLAHELEIVKHLADVEGVTKLADLPSEPNTMLLTDEGGTSLTNYLRSSAFSPLQCVTLAVNLARTLAGVHAAGVIHRDISPDNIVISLATRQPIVIDFNIAARIGEQESDQKGELVGTLAYMSPEQTGRSGRKPDQRSDLYSLGATLYEVATRRRPFVSDDVLELVHDHLVRIPDAPHVVNGEVPRIFSDLIMRLLNKEPDYRYQSAQGLLHDLTRIEAGLSSGNLETFELAQFDFGSRLNPPARLLGRDAELAVLRETLARVGERAVSLLISGAPGVGKSALLAELKPLAAGKAMCVFGKFDQYKQDSSEAALGIFQALARQLLAGSEDNIARHRESIRAALGNNLGVGPTLLPEFKLLLGDHRAVEIAEAGEAEARTAQAALAILRAVARPEHPVILVMDDMQWAPPISLRIVDAIINNAESLPGLAIVGARRLAGELTNLDRQLAQWTSMELAPPEIQLECLSQDAATEFIAAMLRQPLDAATQLAPVLAERTGNNPYTLVEVINALRQDGLLTFDNGAWSWDASAIRRHVGNTSVADLLKRRFGKLPAQACEMMQSVACLGGDVDVAVLSLACALDERTTQDRLAPSVDDGLLALAIGDDKTSVRFVSGRVQEAVFEGMQPDARAALHLSLARHIADQREARSDLEALASEQYLAAAELVESESERRLAVSLFERAAKRLRLLNGGVAQKFLAAAVKLLKPIETATDNAQLFALECELHRALLGLGRLEEVDAVWESINRRAPDAASLAEPTRIQMYSLNNRRRFADSMNMGLALLAKVGFEKPADVRPAIGAGLKRMAEFSAGETKKQDFERAEATDARVILLSNIVPHTTTPAYYADPAVWAWLSLEAQALWIEHGPGRMLLSGMCSGPSLLVGMMQSYRYGYDLGCHLIAVGEHRNYQPAVSYARTMCGISASHWFEPLETTVAHFRRSFNDLVSLGDESFFLNNFVSFDPLFDYSPTLDEPMAELELGFSHANRIRQMDFQLRYRPRMQMVLALRGQTKMPGSLEDDNFDEAKFLSAIDMTSVTAWVFHVVSGMTALIFGDIAKVGQHTAAAMPLNARAPGYYLNATLRLLHGIALAEKARGLPPGEREPVLAELDACLQWISARATDAPMNFLHLQKWLEAERAWAAESIWKAGLAFEAALMEAAQHNRPWHRAALAERAARFHLQHGLEQSGRELMTQAFELYTAWGAAGKVKELRRQHGFLRTTNKARTDGTATSTLRGTMVDTDMVDMLGVLRASQALSSETNLQSLTAAVGKVLGAITGATRVQLAVKSEDGASWVMAQSLAHDSTPVALEEASAVGELPYSVFKYAERINQVLVIEDLVADERFNNDPYAEKFAQCSMMLVPVLKQGQLNGMLVLENEQRRGAFSAERLDAVAMIAGQLSVSLDNALLYASLERRVAERTAQLRQKTADINAMLQNMPQGVLTVTSGGVVHPEYSAYLATILETDQIAGRNVMELLFAQTSLGADVLSQVDAAIGACIGEDAMNFDFNAHLLVGEFDIKLPSGAAKSLALSWSPICDDAGTIEKLMLCVRDVTELKRLEAEASARKRELEMIGEILAVSQEKFHEFIDSARAFIAENRRIVDATTSKQADAVNLLFRNMHTIKGNARTYGFFGLTNLAHAVEQTYDELRKSDAAEWNVERLRDELQSVQTALEKYAHVNDAVLGRKGPGRRADADKFLIVEKAAIESYIHKLQQLDLADATAMREAVRVLRTDLNLLGTRSLHDVLEGTVQSLPSLAQELGKEAPEVSIQEHDVAVRTQSTGVLRNLFTHLLRNAVDHGIESTEERLRRGKPARGRIAISAALDGDRLVLRLRDDGRGLAIGKIRQRALEQGLIDANASATDVAQLIFRSGFSTADKVTEVSGRGVGMDAVRGFLQDEGGSIDIRFLDDETRADFRAFETVIYLPSKYAAPRTPHPAGQQRV